MESIHNLKGEAGLSWGKGRNMSTGIEEEVAVGLVVKEVELVGLEAKGVWIAEGSRVVVAVEV